jgi:glyoxylase-like metal-dependent hydrolase (beta-lactamase superfamily II)
MKTIRNMAFLSLLALPSLSQGQHQSTVQVSATKVAGQVYMLTGSGGNIGVLATDAGLLLVDDQYQSMAKKIETAMSTLSTNNTLKYVVNTHYHGDHTGGNSYFSDKAPIFAHHNVRKRLGVDKENTDPALPVVTYKDGVEIHLATETITLTHLPGGHTDGDSIVYFQQANVLHTGDLFFQGRFPYVDLNGGGSVKGYLANVDHIIDNTPDDVMIIPGHGLLANKDELKVFAAMLSYSIDRVSKALADGKTQQEILAMGIGEQYQSYSWRFITEERWLNTLITDLK